MKRIEFDETHVRLVAAYLNAPRFRGRAQCYRLAVTGDRTAQRALELSKEHRLREALRGGFSEDVLRALALGEVIRAERLRAERAARRQGGDPLARREPGQARQRAALTLLRRALERAEFRAATHRHETVVRLVEEGAESASSSTTSVRPTTLGLPQAYAKVAYWVTTSLHEWQVSTRILGAPSAGRGVVYLSRELRVRQGRGTSLVVERRRGPRGGWQ